jgi:hypothetical protein
VLTGPVGPAPAASRHCRAALAAVILAAGTLIAMVHRSPAIALIGTMTDPHNFDVPSLAFSPSSQTLAIGDYDGRTYLWHVG